MKSQEQLQAESNARLNTLLGQYYSEREANGQGVSEKEYDAQTAALRAEAARLEALPVGNLSTSGARERGIRIGELERSANQRDIEKPLYQNMFAQQDRARQQQKQIAEQGRVSAIRADLEGQTAQRNAAIDALLEGSSNAGALISGSDKRKLVTMLYDGAGETDKHGRFVAFRSESGLPTRAYVFNDGTVGFVGETE